MDKPALYLWVGLGSALGGMGRVWLTGVVVRRMGETFPWGTLLVNVTGSLFIGFLAGLIGPESRLHSKLHPFIFQFFMAGLCGGYTTFSSFSLQTLELLRHGQWLHAGGNAVFSVVLCLVFVWLGYWLGQTVNR